MPGKRPADTVSSAVGTQPRVKQRKRGSRSRSEAVGTQGKPARTLTRSARQGGLLETLILGDQPQSTVRRLWSSEEDVLLRQAVNRMGA